MLVVGSGTGRQGSTTGIGIGLAILAAPFLGALGLGFGRLVALVVKPVQSARWLRFAGWCAPLALVAIAVVASVQASGPIHVAERQAVPRVMVNLLPLHRQGAAGPTSDMTRASRVYDHLAKMNEAIPWGDGTVLLTNAGDNLQVSFEGAGGSLLIPLQGIDYINFIDAVPMMVDASDRPALALLITGRATGRRDLLAVVSGSRELVYLELLERSWDFRSVPLAIRPSTTGDQILIGSELTLGTMQ